MTDKKDSSDVVNGEPNGDTIEDAGTDKQSLVDANENLEKDDGIVEKTELETEIETQKSEEWYPDGGWGWAVVIGAVIIHVYVGGYMKSSGVMYLKFKDQFNQSAVATAWVFSLYTTFLLLLGPLGSALCNRFSCRTVVFWGTVMTVVGQILSAYAPNIEFTYFSYSTIGGIGRCLTYTPSLILVNEYFNKRRGLAVGISTAGVGLGMFTFPPLIEALFVNYGYKGAMIILTGVCCEAFVAAALFMPIQKHKKIVEIQRINRLVKMSRQGDTDAREELQALHTPNKPIYKASADSEKKQNGTEAKLLTSSTEDIAVVIFPKETETSTFRENFNKFKQFFKKSKSDKEKDKKKKPLLELSLLKDFPFFSLCLSILFFTSSMMSTYVFLPPLAKSSGVTELQAAYLVSIIGVCDSVARFTSGIVLDMKRVKKFRLLAYNADMFCVVLVTVVMPSLYGFPAFAVAACFYGFFVGTYIAQKSVVVVDMLGYEKMTSSYGLLLGFQGMGALIGPTMSGLFKDVFGTYSEAFYVGAGGVFLGGLVLAVGNTWKICRERRAKRAAKLPENEVLHDE